VKKTKLDAATVSDVFVYTKCVYSHIGERLCLRARSAPLVRETGLNGVR